MARLLIASRSMALALRLADVHEIVEHSPDELDDLLPGEDVDAVVLDVGDPRVAVDAVRRLRGLGYETPVLLVSGYQHEWTSVAGMGLPGVKVVPLPITRVALLEGVGYLTGAIVDLSSIPPTPAGTIPVVVAGPEEADAEDAEDVAEAADGEAEDVAEGTGDEDGDEDGAADDVEAIEAAAVEPIEAAEADEEPAAVAAAEAAAPPTVGAGVPVVVAPQAEDQASAGEAPTPPPAVAEPRPWGLPMPVPPTPPGPGPHTPSWGVPVADDEWGPAPHLPPSTTHPMSTVPQTPHGGIRRPVPTGGPQPPQSGGDDSRGPSTGGLGLGLGLGRRRPLRGGRRGRGRQGVAAREATPAEGTQQVAVPQAPPTPREPTPPDVGVVAGVRDAASPPEPMPFVAAPEPDPLLTSALEQRLDAEAAAGAVGPGAGQPRTPDLVSMLLERTDELYGVVDTAQVLADDVVERADADAAAVLVPDGPIWRVSAGVGLRPLERRLILDESHWMITEIASTGRAVLVEDTDIVRQQLAGAPLAAWRHLLAVPVPDVRAAVILARGQEAGPFTDRDLTAVVPTVREAATLLAQALEARRLARMLSPLREEDNTARG